MTNRPNKEHAANAIESDPIHRILSSEEQILPSSGFLASVMERVEEESRVPAPIPFPWKRALPGFVLAAGMFGWVAYEFVRDGIPSLRNFALAQSPLPAPVEQAAWVALALAVSLASWKLSRRLSGQS